MSDKIEKDIKRIYSYSAELRGRQNSAAKASRSKEVPKNPTPIIDKNTDAFIAQALSNGLDLATISAAAVAKKTNTKK